MPGLAPLSSMPPMQAPVPPASSPMGLMNLEMSPPALIQDQMVANNNAANNDSR